MKYNLAEALEILERTTAVPDTMLNGLSNEWVVYNEGPEIFSPYDVLGHLIHGEKADWTERIKRITKDGDTKAFEIIGTTRTVDSINSSLCARHSELFISSTQVKIKIPADFSRDFYFRDQPVIFSV